MKKEKQYISILEIGEFWDSPDITRVFVNEKTAMKYIPKGFEKDYGLYFEHKNKRRWASVKTFEVEVK